MSKQYRFLGAFDRGGDVLEIRYQLEGEERPRTVTGWVSATQSHYEPAAYRDDGHRDPKAKPRAMTPAELRAYCEALIEAAHPEPAAQAEPVELLAPDPHDDQAPAVE